MSNSLLFRLEETGQTALGPALLVSISMASRVPGSKVRLVKRSEKLYHGSVVSLGHHLH